MAFEEVEAIASYRKWQLQATGNAHVWSNPCLRFLVLQVANEK